MDRQIVRTDKAPEPVGPYSQAIKAGDWLYVSGQIPIDSQTGALVEGPFASQVHTVLENVKAIIEEAGSNLENVVKVTIYLADMDRFPELNAIYEEYFSTSRPARACVEVSRLPKDVPLEIEAVALLA